MKVEILYLTLTIILILFIIEGCHIYNKKKKFEKSAVAKMKVDLNTRLNTLKLLYDYILEVADIIDAKPFILYGTLLGKYRENNFIECDYDVDFGAINEDFVKFYNYFKKNPIIETETFPIKLDTINKNYIQLKHNNSISLDIFNYKLKDNKINKTKYPIILSLFTSECRYYMPKEWVLPLKQVEFLGKEVYVPNQSDKLLECYYGKDYMIPTVLYDKDLNKCIKLKNNSKK